MAIQLRGDRYRVLFRFQGKQYAFPLGLVSQAEAEAKSVQVGYLLLRLAQRLLELPPGDSIVDFLRFDGKIPAKAEVVTRNVTRRVTLGGLRDRLLAGREGGRELRTLKTSRIHFKHLATTLGEKFPLAELTQAVLQGHIGLRAKKGISATTIRKETTTLRTAWHWAIDTGELTGDYPNKGLIYLKEDELPHYQTREELERQVSAGDLTTGQIDALYLRPGGGVLL